MDSIFRRSISILQLAIIHNGESTGDCSGGSRRETVYNDVTSDSAFLIMKCSDRREKRPSVITDCLISVM